MNPALGDRPNDRELNRHADWTVAIVRTVLGLKFFAHGAQKMLGWYGGPGLVRSMRTFTEDLHLPSTLFFL
jgi:putative oxidoreductase